jgi:hypothetical protein
VDIGVLNIALSPGDSHVKLWDLESKECLAHLEFDSVLLNWNLRLSFASDEASVSVEHIGCTWSWHISPAFHINQNTPSIQHNDSTRSWFTHLLLNGKARGSSGVSISIEHKGCPKWWHISPTSHTTQTTPSILNDASMKSWLIGYARPGSRAERKMRMVFVSVAEQLSNQDAPKQSYSCDEDGEWMLDQYGRCILWIPPDERPQKTKIHL